MIRRAYGTVYAAFDNKNKRVAAIKRIQMKTDSIEIPKECEILRDCDNDFIVRYYDYLTVDGELWVLITRTVHH